MRFILEMTPKLVESILNDRWRWLCLKTKPKGLERGDTIMLYATEPVNKVLGEIYIHSTDTRAGNIHNLWEWIMEDAGSPENTDMKEEDFLDFYGHEEWQWCYAICLAAPRRYSAGLEMELAKRIVEKYPYSQYFLEEGAVLYDLFDDRLDKILYTPNWEEEVKRSKSITLNGYFH